MSNMKERLKKAATKKVVVTVVGAALFTVAGITVPEPALDAVITALAVAFGW